MNSGSSLMLQLAFRSYTVMLFAGVVMLLSSCGSSDQKIAGYLPVKAIAPSRTDDILLPDGYNYEVMITGFDTLGQKTMFGYDVSGLTYLGDDSDEGTLWVNHELMNPMLASGYYGDMARLRKQIRLEQKGVGFTALKIARKDGKWEPRDQDLVNLRTNATDNIAMKPAIGTIEKARGTLANGSVIRAPWEAVLSAESHYDRYIGDVDYETGNYRPSQLRWEAFTGESPYQYGWVMETSVDEFTTTKLTNIGRMKRGGIALGKKDSQSVLYFTDERVNGSLYKYVSNASDNLDEGLLYVADLTTNSWLPLSMNNEKLAVYFNNRQEDLLLNLSLAGRIAGGTPLDQPSGLAIDPFSGDLLMAVTNNLATQQYHGRVLRIKDSGGTLSWDTELEGGIDNEISCPAYLHYDPQGNLWIATGIPAQLANQGPYVSFGNNGLFVLPKGGDKTLQIASAPVDARFGGMSFTPDGKYLFLGVQQPGSRSTSVYDFDFTSHWPRGGAAKPESAVVVITRN